MSDRTQSLSEEIANSVSHGVGLLAAIISFPFLIAAASPLGIAQVVGASIFGATLVLLYLTSTLYHALPDGQAKQLWMKLDHGAIYLFIAGSYTPFALGAVVDSWSWALLALVWSFALLGATLKLFDRLKHPWLSTGLYLVMGWLVLFAALPLVEHLSQLGVTFLISGGVAYTIGVVFFALDSRLRYAHTIWHGFVIAGSGCHAFAILNYAV